MEKKKIGSKIPNESLLILCALAINLSEILSVIDEDTEAAKDWLRNMNDSFRDLLKTLE